LKGDNRKMKEHVLRPTFLKNGAIALGGVFQKSTIVDCNVLYPSQPARANDLRAGCRKVYR
jgi:hypothetical protein